MEPYLGGRRDLDALLLTIGEARVDLLSRLGDGAQHLFEGELGAGDDGGSLALEGDFVGLDACDTESEAA